MQRWLTVSEVARRLGLSPDGVRHLERRGRLRAIRTEGKARVRLFREAEVERLVKRRRASQSGPAERAPQAELPAAVGAAG